MTALPHDAVEVRIRLPARKKWWNAGQNSYLTLPYISRWPLEAHPMTIASIAETFPRRSSSCSAVSSETIYDTSTPSTSSRTLENGSGKSTEGDQQEEVELRHIIRAYSGFTRRLLEATQHEGGILNTPVFVDGPYGHPPDLTGYETVVLIAGESTASGLKVRSLRSLVEL